jgi:hypothetical protein
MEGFASTRDCPAKIFLQYKKKIKPHVEKLCDIVPRSPVKMASYDSDSSAGEDEEYTETDVLLGYASIDSKGETVSRLGGLPVRIARSRARHIEIADLMDSRTGSMLQRHRRRHWQDVKLARISWFYFSN